MKGLFTFISFLAIGTLSFGQVTSDNAAQGFEERGMKLISEVSLSQVEIEQLLSFDFEPYREKDEYVIVKVLNGPNIQLYSSTQFHTGKADPPIIQRVQQHNEAEENQIEHKDDHHEEIEVRILQVRTVDVFGTEQIAK